LVKGGEGGLCGKKQSLDIDNQFVILKKRLATVKGKNTGGRKRFTKEEVKDDAVPLHH
jgi:hypothetical protein